MPHDTEEWCKIRRKTDLLFQEWQKLVEFSSKQSKDSKICTLIGPFRANYRTFDPKKCRRVIMALKSCNIWRKTDLWFRNDMMLFDNFSLEHLKVSKLVVMDCQQITFIPIDGFCLLNKSPLCSSPVLNQHYQNGRNTNQSQVKNTCPFYIVFWVLNIHLTKICKTKRHEIFYFLLFLLDFPSADILFFSNF